MYIPSIASAKASMPLVYMHIFCVRLLQVCSFNEDGQYQSLGKWNGQQVWLSRFFCSTFIDNDVSPKAQIQNMPFCKVKSNCQNERDVITLGFSDLFSVVEAAKQQTEHSAKAELYDIISDYSISDEEKASQERPFIELIAEQEEKDIRIRRTILMGLFSFWEISLAEMCRHYKLDLKKMPKPKQKDTNKHKDKHETYNSYDYVYSIYHDDLPESVSLINDSIRELRNYMVHGESNPIRQEIIKSLVKEHPEYGIVYRINDCYMSSYRGLKQIFTLIKQTLNDTENYITSNLNIK